MLNNGVHDDEWLCHQVQTFIESARIHHDVVITNEALMGHTQMVLAEKITSLIQDRLRGFTIMELARIAARCELQIQQEKKAKQEEQQAISSKKKPKKQELQ